MTYTVSLYDDIHDVNIDSHSGELEELEIWLEDLGYAELAARLDTLTSSLMYQPHWKTAMAKAFGHSIMVQKEY